MPVARHRNETTNLQGQKKIIGTKCPVIVKSADYLTKTVDNLHITRQPKYVLNETKQHFYMKRTKHMTNRAKAGINAPSIIRTTGRNPN